MKKITLSLLAVAAMGNTLMAGGDVVNVTPEPVYQEVAVADDSGFYTGLAYSYFSLDEGQPSGVNVDVDYDMVNLIAGYNFNKYVAVEGRLGLSMGDADLSISGVDEGDWNSDASTFSIFVKPQYSYDAFKVYGLLGYGSTRIDSSAEGAYDVTDTDFQYGLGASYTIDNFEIFADYTVLYDDNGIDGIFPENDYKVDAWTVGLNYKF